ncbi:MAG: sulfotransferase family protein, partial [Gammaproteobacteria bacterium]
LVEDFEAQAREITTFLGIPWHAALLAPGEHARAKGFISTPSYAQVIEPVNRRAVGRWQPYARYFDEALPVLAPYLERWHYGR